MKAGIDLGTSYSSISIINKDGKPEPVKVSNGVSVFGDSYSLPSAVYADNDKITVGQAALVDRMRNPENFKCEFKRDLGQEIPYSLGNKQFYPQDLYREIFIYLKKCAEEYTGEIIEFACITHPANYNERKKKLVYEAAKTAGILNIELLDEPSAAALYYCTDKKLVDGSTLLVYDFGGGTFDASIIEYQKGKFETLTSPQGIERCGGVDIDRLIFDHVMSKISSEKIAPMKTNPLNFKRFRARINELSVRAKHHLSTSESYSDDIEIGFDYENYDLSRKHFNSLITGLVEDTFACTNQILQNAEKKITELDTVLLVGGSSRIPLVREHFQRIIPKNLCINTNPELAVSMGAALYAGSSNGMKRKNEVVKTVFCIRNGEKISTNDKFCPFCGTPNFSYRKE
jgi:molecular chaperone DnaK (HSP70)